MTSGNGPLLGRSLVERALRRLGERLARGGVTTDMYVFGGAAMALAYEARRATRDVNAIFSPHGIVVEEVERVARELGLRRFWLDEQASVYVSPTPDTNAPRIFDSPGLRVSAASPAHLLALKALAARRFADVDDLVILVRQLGITSVGEVEEVCANVFPEEQLTRRSRLVLEDVVEQNAARGPLAPDQGRSARWGVTDEEGPQLGSGKKPDRASPRPRSSS